MIRRLLTVPPTKPDGFNHRGMEVTRLEAFSDAAFGFAVTLLVVSLEVPNTFDELLDRMSGFVAFAICFALLVHFWAKHVNFFRRYGLRDTSTIILNATLLFVLLLYIYPLKYLFSVVAFRFLGLGPASLQTGLQTMTLGHQRSLFAIYGVGYFAIYALYATLYGHAYRMRKVLSLSRLEVFDTLASIAHNLGIAAVGLLSVVISQVAPLSMTGWAGWCYGLIGPIAATIGWRTGVLRQRIHPIPTG